MLKGKTDEAENILRESLDKKTTACPENKASIAMSELLSCLRRESTIRPEVPGH